MSLLRAWGYLRATGLAIGVAGTATVVVACSSRSTDQNDRSRVDVPVLTSSPVASARMLARPDTRISAVLAAADLPWASDGAGFVARHWVAGNDPSSVGARAPGDARSSFTVGLLAPRSRLAVTLEGARAAAPHVEEGSIVYPGAYPSTDVVITLGGGRFEELLLLRDARAPVAFGWRVALPEGIANVRVDDDGGVRFEDSRGNGVLRVPPAYAVDATGARRAAQLSWSESGLLAVTLDTSGLVYPVLLDPAVESYFWVKRTSAANPGVRDSHVMAYDAAKGNTVLFSGDICTTACAMAPNDTWTWNGTAWTLQTVTNPPMARYWAGMVFDGAQNVNLLYGGVQANGNDLSDTWAWNGSSWTEMYPSANPGARDSFGLAYDSTRQVVVLFGGEKCANSGCTTMTNLNDTWEWNGTNWTKMSTSSAPAARLGMGMAFDAAHQVSVLFGGTTCSASCQTNIEYADTWEWNGTTWAVQSPANAPSPRDSFGFAYDSLRGVTVLYGGFGSSGDTWEWNGSTWTNVTPDTAPSYRYWAPLTFDSARGRAVLYGGTNGASDLSDTWEYYALGGTCTAGTQCDSGFCVDGVCCGTSSCGTCQACNTAASPGTCAAVTNAPDPPSCTGTQTCDGTGVCKLVVGQACPDGNTDCANGACVDGYCCNTACTSACDVCADALGAPANGTCGPAAKGYSGDPPCASGYVCNGSADTCPAACSADADCAAGYFCGASGTCQPQKTPGGTCSATAGVDCLQGQCRECASGNCVDGVCCNSACAGSCDVCAQALGASADGTCTTAPQGYAGAPTCSPYVCTGASVDCPVACTLASECATGAFCASGQCQGTETAGQPCGSNGACLSGFCVDGACCNSACAGECEACDVEGSVGACTPVAGTPHGSRPACPVASETNPCSAAQCDGNTRTSCTGFVGSAVTCVQASCTSGVATLPAACDGMGSCPTPVTKDCAPYACGATSCESVCASDTDCAAGERCDPTAGTCVSGVTCDGDHTITNGNGQTMDCSPYTCSPAGCQTSCQSILDCVSPSVCNGSSQCVLPSETGVGASKATCSVSRTALGTGARGSPPWLVGFLLFGVSGWSRRRRRRSLSGGGTSSR